MISDSELMHLGITRAQLSGLHDYESLHGVSIAVRELILEELLKELLNYSEEFDPMEENEVIDSFGFLAVVDEGWGWGKTQ